LRKRERNEGLEEERVAVQRKREEEKERKERKGSVETYGFIQGKFLPL
jgi:hypothetical protein